MTTTYRVTARNGHLLGIFPQGAFAEIRALVQANPGADVKPVVTVDNPCATHPAFEASYCPNCPTSDTNRYIAAAGR